MSIRAAAGLLAAALVVGLSGCARQADTPGPVAATTTPTPQGADPLASAPVPPPPLSSTFTWPKPTKRTVKGTARGTPNLSRVNRSDPDAVAEAFAVTAYTVDTRSDLTPAAGGMRAAALAAQRLAAQLRQPRSPAVDADWTALERAEGYRTVKATANRDEGGPEGDSTTAYASYTLAVLSHPGQATTVTVFIKLARPTSTAPWAVDEMRVSA